MSVTEEKPRHQKAPAPPKSPGTSVTEARQQIVGKAYSAGDRIQRRGTTHQEPSTLSKSPGIGA